MVLRLAESVIFIIDSSIFGENANFTGPRRISHEYATIRGRPQHFIPSDTARVQQFEQLNMEKDPFISDLLAFVGRSPTPFHAAASMQARFFDHGFALLDERHEWDLHAGGRYVVTRNGSSLIAFVVGRHAVTTNGIRMVGAHTDSPCLKVKPLADITHSPYLQLGVEVYGGALLNPWFDRDLSLAGRVTYRTSAGEIASTNIDFREPIAVIPSLAIHLDRDANKNRSINSEQHVSPVVLIRGNAEAGFLDLVKRQLLDEHPGRAADSVLAYELSLYDTQAPAIVGINREFITGARFDNLLSCYCGASALLDAGDDVSCMLVCNDHEEVGSASACGAQGPFLKSVLERITANPEALTRALDRSLIVSADNAHAAHPNYADKHDARHRPVLNGGPAIKINANQRYATNSQSAAVFQDLCAQAGVPVQTFVSRSDLACGSTIGPITASEIGINTVDVGIPQWAMHSIRETAGSADSHYLYLALQELFRLQTLPI